MAITKNIGIKDRAIRIILGIGLLALVSLVFIGPRTPWAYIGLIGLLPLIAGIVGNCPPYTRLGINTYKGHSTN